MRNEARIVYLGLDDEERVKLSALPEDEQYVIKTMFLPSLSIGNESHCFPYHLFHTGSRIVIYGAGNVGKQFYYRALQDAKVNIVGIVDINAENLQEGVIPILPVPMLKQLNYDYILIAVENEDIAKEIENNLIEMDIPEYKLKWDGPVYRKNNYDRKPYEYRKFVNRLMQSGRKRFFLFGLPEHGNMGDYAIGIAEKQFFDDYFPEYELIRVTTNEWVELKSYFIANIKKTDILFVTGGGFIGDMWATGSASMDIAQAFPDNLKIFMPNTLTYHDIQKESLVLGDLEKLCAAHHTYLFFREKNSFDLCRNLGFGDWCYCFPDMALYLKHNIVDKQRKGKVLLCFRTDAEKIFQEQDNLKRLLTCNQIPYDEKDIHLYKYVPENESEFYIAQLIQEFSEYDMIITDRLHGMLLSYMSKTPCAAFDNATHKVAGVYEWIKAEPEIEFFEKYDEDKLLNFINEYKGKKVTGCQKEQLSSQFELLYRTIKKLVLSDTEVGV
jgi:exopolysaccharide biosynthesis predicted pyruvyltransferase EpsI